MRTISIWILVKAAEMADQLAIRGCRRDVANGAFWPKVIDPEIVYGLQT